MQLQWILKPFNQLSVNELYAILKLRNEVFIVEQNCPFQDLDGKDQESYHLMGLKANELAAYTRIIPAGICYPEASIGRVITSPKYRGEGFGEQLMKRSIALTFELFKCDSIKIGAQLYLQKFYEKLGFVQSSAEYLEDGISHIEMLLTK